MNHDEILTLYSAIIGAIIVLTPFVWSYSPFKYKGKVTITLKNNESYTFHRVKFRISTFFISRIIIIDVNKTKNVFRTSKIKTVEFAIDGEYWEYLDVTKQ